MILWQIRIPPEQVSDEAALLPIQDVVAYLQEHLGQRMTAYISGVKDPKMVARWIARQNLPRDEAQIRLREAYQATRLLVDAYGDETAKAWLFGSNAELGEPGAGVHAAPGAQLGGSPLDRPGCARVRTRRAGAERRCCAAESPAHQAAPALGRDSQTSAPPPGRFAACALPPCASAIVRTIERPSPEPAPDRPWSGRAKRVNACGDEVGREAVARRRGRAVRRRRPRAAADSVTSPSP